MVYGSMLFQIAILVGWTGLLLWGSIMAIRGRRMWATSMLMIGSVCMLVGIMGGMLGFYGFWRSTGSLGDVLQLVAMLAAFLIPVGLLIVSIGFVGVCARFGLAERRAQELEVLVVQLQQRINSGQ